MILIYNLPGLLIGVAGLAAGLLMLLATGWWSASLLGAGLVWLIFGRGKFDPSLGTRRPSPTFFYIPLFYWSFLVLIAIIPAVVIDQRQAKKNQDPRYVQFKADETALDREVVSGDPELGQLLIATFRSMFSDDKTHVFSSIQGDRLLILGKVPRLKEVETSARPTILASLEEVIRSHPAAKGRQLYLGIKGGLTYGIVKTPQGSKVGKVNSSEPLLGFYQPAPVP